MGWLGAAARAAQHACDDAFATATSRLAQQAWAPVAAGFSAMRHAQRACSSGNSTATNSASSTRKTEKKRFTKVPPG